MDLVELDLIELEMEKEAERAMAWQKEMSSPVQERIARGGSPSTNGANGGQITVYKRFLTVSPHRLPPTATDETLSSSRSRKANE